MNALGVCSMLQHDLICRNSVIFGRVKRLIVCASLPLSDVAHKCLK